MGAQARRSNLGLRVEYWPLGRSMTMECSQKGVHEYTCICGYELGKGNWMEVHLPCGHRNHVGCLRSRMLNSGNEEALIRYDGDVCSRCTEFTFKDLRFLRDECSERSMLNKRSPDSVELWIMTEIKKSRP